MPDREVEHLVVGAGLLGLSTARALTRRGRSVAVLERAAVGHAGSGSKGTARIFRLGYPDPFYVRLAQASLPRWRALEDESGRTLLRTTGAGSLSTRSFAPSTRFTAASAAFKSVP